jgi:hypothetical protein
MYSEQVGVNLQAGGKAFEMYFLFSDNEKKSPGTYQ